MIRLKLALRCFAAALIACIVASPALAWQPGKDGVGSVTTANTVINTYTTLNGAVAQNATTITVTSAAALTGLSVNDVLLIYNPQGATITSPDTAAYGAISALNNAGRFEFVNVDAINGNILTIDSGGSANTCGGGLRNSYDNGAEVVRVPQYSSLTISGAGSVTAQAWNGTTGGIVAALVQNTASVGGAGISAAAQGFRGGALTNNTGDQGTNWTYYRVNAATQGFTPPSGTGTIQGEGGAQKGESIAGNLATYESTFNGGYGRGAPANGGGGGTAHNGGGGGGANGDNGVAWTGQGNPDNSVASYSTAWDLDGTITHTSVSSGGGRGGYTYAASTLDPTTTAPGNAGWGGNNRRERGGLGGRPLTNDPSTAGDRLFFGGGGGAGDENNTAGTAGGNGGGIVFLIADTISGAGTINVNGATAANNNGLGTGNDAPGGGGAGGSVVLMATTSLSGVTVTANGGKGGNQHITSAESEGAGGGGGGGYIAVSGGAPASKSAVGGVNGTSDSSGITQPKFPANGATLGAAGNPNGTAPATLSGFPICTSADLSVTKTDGVASINAGATATYTIVVSNAGPSAANGAILTDPAVANLTVTGVTCGTVTNGAVCPAAGVVTVANLQGAGIAIPTLPSTGTVTFTVTGTAGASGTIANVATIAPPAGTTDPTPGNNSATDTDTINPRADLSITKNDGIPNVNAGTTHAYTIVVSNAGPSAADGAIFQDPAVANIVVTNVSCGSPTGGAVCPVAPTVVAMQGAGIAIPTLPNGGSVTFTVTYTAGTSGSFTNTATITAPAGVTDPTLINNSASDTDLIIGLADLAITKTDGVASVNAGGAVTYTIVVSNAGPSPANNARFTDPAVANLTVSNVTCGTATGGAVCPATSVAAMQGAGISIATLPSGGSVTFTVTGTAGASGSIVNTATIAVPVLTNDPDPTNNSATDTDTINPQADLSITKTDGTASYTPGATTTYTIVVSNAGPSVATGATIADTLPASFTSDTWTAVASGGATGFSASGSGNINDTVNMPVGSSITYTLSATISLAATGNISNTATVTAPAGVTDPNAGNNSATDTDSNGGTQQLSIAKTATPAAFAVGQSGTYSIVVSNSGTTSTSGAITINDPLPAGITTTATPSGTGWNCSASTATNISCMTAAVLLPGGNAPVVNAPITVAVTTASPAVNTATTSGGGDATCPAAAHCQSTISTPVNAALINVTKSLVGSLVVGVQTNYIITATNNGQAATLAGTITDTIPTGLTIGTLPAPCSAVGQAITCTIPAGIATGGSVSFTIPVTPQASVSGTNVSNTATDNNGGDPTCPAAGHCNGTTTNTVTAPQLSLTKSATPTTFVVNQPATYTLTLTNTGTAATTATVTISDVIPGGLTIGTLPAACSAVGQTVTCTQAAPLNIGTPVTFTIPVTPTNALNGLSATNTAGANGGGDPGCPVGTPTGGLPARCVGTVTTSVNAPQLTITKTASGTFAVGVPASYLLQVQNTGTAATSGTITITDVIPGSLTIGSLPAGCSAVGQQVTCTSAASLAVNGTISFTIPVTPTASASPSVSNTASVQGGGDPTCPTTPNCTSTITTSVSAPQLQVTKTSNGPWTVNQAGATYTLTVKNAGTAATSGTITISDTLPGGITPQWIGTLTTGPWSCTFAGQAVTCTGASSLAINATSSATLPVNVTVAAVPGGSGPSASITNNASVGGGGDPFDGGSAPTPGASCTSLDPANPGHCASTTTTVNALADVAIVKSTAAPNPAVPGNGVTWTITVTNNGPSEASAVTTSDNVPATVTGLSLGGADAGSCSIAGQTVSCAFGTLANGATRTFTISGTLAASFTGTLSNTATVSSTTSDPTPGNNTSTSTTPTAASADLSITKTDGVAAATPGGSVTYTITASNTGPSNATGATVADTFPATITSATWTCVGAGGGTCTASGSGNINDTVNLPSGGSVTYTVTANISAAATGTLSNTATVAPPVGVTDPTPGNNSATDSDTLNPSADLSVTKTDGTSSYTPGSTTTYTIVVSNAGPSVATGATITDTLPASITSDAWTATATGGATGFSASGSGNINDTVNMPVGSSITYTLSATISLAATGNISNTATVTVPGGVTDPNPGNNSATDTDSNGGAQQLSIAKTATPGAFAVGQTGTYSLVVSNTGTTSTAGAITVSDTLPAGITTTATPSGTGWNCSASTATLISCTTPAVLLPGGNAPVINATVAIAVGTASPAVNTASVSGGGDASCPAAAHCQSTISTPVNAPLIDVTKSLQGSLVVGVPTSYIITATNNGQAVTLAGTITDTIPAGLTIGTLPGGCSAVGQNLTCTLPAGIATGGSVSYTIPVTPQASVSGSNVSNTATDNGGGDPSCPAAGHCNGTTTNTVTAPQLSLTKSASPTTFEVNQLATYTLTLTNIGTAATTATVTISDTIPGGLTIGSLPGACSVAGQTVTCTVAAPLNTGAPVTFNIAVTPTNALNGSSVTNTAGATGGGDPGCATGTPIGSLPARCVGTVTDSVNAPQLTITKSASGASFVVGVAASYTLQVTNTGSAATNASSTITDVIPNSLTLGTLPAGCSATGQQVTCTIASGLGTGSSVSFVIPVTPAASAMPSVSNTATVQGGGDPTCPTTSNCSSTVTTPVNAPQLTIQKTASASNFVVGVPASYTLQVTNTGTAATTATTTVTDNVPGTLTIGTLPAGCTAVGQTVTCTIATAFATGNSVSFVIPVTPTAAANGSTLTNTATVSGGGDPTCPGGANCSSTTTTPVNAPALSIVKTASGPNFVVGVPASYTLQVTNTGTAATTATTTVSDNIPGVLTIGTLPAGCSAAGQTVTCTIAAGLTTGSPVSFLIPVTPTAAASGATLTNTATVSGGGDPSCPGGANCSSTVTTPVDAPALQIVKSASASNFVVGVAASYTLQVTNTGTAATTSATTVTDNIPGSLIIGTLPAGCSASGQTVTCTIATGLATGAPVSFVIPVTPTAAASGTTLTNTAIVSGGGDPTCPGGASCSSTVTTPVDAPALQIVKTASASNFVVGVPASYTLQVTNTGTAATTATTTITDNIPGSLTIGTLPAGCSASGQSVACTIATGLATGSPVSFVIPVTPTAAASGATLTNTATVSGGGDPTCPGGANCSSSTTTPVNAPALQIVKTASASNFVVGVAASYTLAVTNTGSAATTAVTTVADNIPGTLTIGTLPAGCNAVGQSVTCTIAAGLTTGTPVSFVIPVTPTAAASGSTLTNTATVSGGGDPTCPGAANCSSTVITPVNAPQLQIVKTASGSNFVVGVAASYTLQVTNIGSAATTAVTTVSDNIPGTLTIGTLPAGCTASGQSVTCTIAAGLATNAPVSFIIPVTATAAASGTTLANTATVSGGGDPSCPGGATCSSTVTTPVASPQLQIVKTASSTTFTVGVAASYTLTVTNTGSAATTAPSSVSDNIPGTLTLGALPAGCTAAGQSVTCTIAAGLATGSPVSFVIPVTPTAAASGSTLTNTATVSGGGDPTCPGAANCSSTVTTPVDQPALRVQKSASATSFVVGTQASYTLTVTNIGSTATTAAATVTDNIPGTLTIGTLPAGCSALGQVVTCTIATGLATGTPVSFVIPVTPTAAANGSTLTNTATVSGGGDPSCPNANNPNCSSTVTTPVGAPALQIVKTASSANFTVGVPASYTLTVTNIGGAATTAVATVSDNVPGTLTIGTLPAGCTASGQVVTCTIAAGLAAGNATSFVIPITPTAAGNGSTVTNTATVGGGGDPSCPGGANCTSTTTTPVGAPQLQIVKTASSPAFAIGVPASYTLTVTNTGGVATTASATVTDNVPGSLTLGTLPGGCNASGQQVTCTIAAGLAPNVPVSFTIPVTPTAAAGGTTVTNTAIVSGGGDPTCPGSANCSSTVDTPVPAGATSADLRIVKTGPATVTAGQNIVYTITVTNVGPDTALGAVLSDPAPAGLTFVSSGAPCPTFPCNLGNIALNQTVTIPNVTFHVAANYPGTSVINIASVTSATQDPTPNNNSSSASTTIIPAGVQAVAPVPVDARWMLLAMMALLAGVGARRVRARR